MEYRNGLGLPTKVLKVRHYHRAGYEVRTELVDNRKFGGDGELEMKSAYNMNGDYIGNSVDAHRLCATYGIKPELSKPNNRVCSIGFCEMDQKWYGWSHRAICEFSIGDTCKKGDCGFDDEIGEWTAKTLEDAKQMAIDFAEDVS